MKFKQQEQQQQEQKLSSGIRVVPKRDKLCFSDLQDISVCICDSHIYASVNWSVQLSRSVTNGP